MKKFEKSFVKYFMGIFCFVLALTVLSNKALAKEINTSYVLTGEGGVNVQLDENEFAYVKITPTKTAAYVIESEDTNTAQVNCYFCEDNGINLYKAGYKTDDYGFSTEVYLKSGETYYLRIRYLGGDIDDDGYKIVCKEHELNSTVKERMAGDYQYDLNNGSCVIIENELAGPYYVYDDDEFEYINYVDVDYTPYYALYNDKYLNDDGEVDYNKVQWINGTPKEPGNYLFNFKLNNRTYYWQREVAQWNDISKYGVENIGNYISDGNTYPVESIEIYDTINEQLVLNTDYEIVGYMDTYTYADENTDINVESNWIKGAPTNSGTYYIRAKGKGDYTGTKDIYIYIISPYDFGTYENNFSFGIPYSEWKMDLSARNGSRHLDVGKDCDYGGFCTEEEYEKADGDIDLIQFDTTGKPAASGYYYIKLIGKGTYANHTSVFGINVEKLDTSNGNVTELKAKEVSINIENGNKFYYVIKPKVSGKYTLTTTSDIDTYGVLFDSTGFSIETNDDREEDNNFLIERELSSSETYYLLVKGFNNETKGPAVVKIIGDGVEYSFREEPKQSSDTEQKPSSTQAPSVESPVAAVTPVEKGTVLKSEKGSFKVTASDTAAPTVAYSGTVNKKAKTVEIPEAVVIDGVKYAVTSIEDNALAKNKKVKSVTIGSNVVKIGSKAFFDCKNLKEIKIKSKKLSKKSFGKNAFGKINKKAKIKVPKKKYKKYKKWLKNTKYPKGVKVVKY